MDSLNENVIFQHVFQSSLEGILVIDNNGNIIKTNPASEQLFGYNKNELIQKKVDSLIPKILKKTKYIEQHLNLWGIKKDGSQFPLELNLNSIEIEKKQVLIAFIINVSERISAKQALVVSENRMEEAQSLAHVGNWYWNIQTNEKNWSNEFYRIFGLLPGDERLNVKSILDFIHPEDRESTIKTVNTAIKNQTLYQHENRILRLDGTIRHIIAKGKVTYNKNKKPIEVLGTIQDITEQKKIEQELKQSEKKNKDILQAIPDLIVVFNKQGVYLDIQVNNPIRNQKLSNKAIGKNVLDVLPKDVSTKIIASFSRIEKTKEPQIIEYSIPVMDTLRYYETRIIAKDTGNFLAIVRDITKRKKAEKNIKENEQRLMLTLEAGEFGSWDWNLLTNKIVRDKYQNSLFGLTDEDCSATYQTFLSKVHSKDRNKVETSISKAIKNTSNYSIDYRITLPDTSIKWLHEKGKVFKNTKGEAVRIIGVTNNITNQKKAAKKLKKSKNKLRTQAIELEEKVTERTKELTATVQKLIASNLSLEDQILITEEAENKVLSSKVLLSSIAQNFPKGFVVVVNQNMNVVFIEGEEIEELGFSNLANLNTNIQDIKGIPDNENEKIVANIKNTFNGEHCSFEINFQKRSYLINTMPLSNNEDNIDQVLLVLNNISKQKQVELEILNTLTKERELSELKSRFISMASHEFRTPLSAILSSAILIEKQNEPGKEEKRINYVSKIRSNVKNLVVILNDFLSLSKLQEGNIIAQPTTFNLVEFTKSLIEEIDGIKKNGQIIKLLCKYKKIEVFLDSKLLKHIIHNLISNAIKYSEENKEVTIKIEIKNQLVGIEIKDQGIGIPIEDQSNMFQKFYRADNASNIQGTGLGLNIVKQYTELIGGTISFKSKLNEGSTFYIEFPLNEKKDEKNIIN
ncbi:PAS domain S-box protein [Lutibacter citreus]|uniref:PAS domain S-box protein n=1 Tax=Lutibacter citreus TaxID=2138210 RepID=UPI000DBE173B|nr:PAS domain S-box protein [Lutibacter citreus]